MIEAKYKEMANFIHQYCVTYGCVTDGVVTGECCKTAKIVGLVCSLGTKVCDVPPHERPACSIYYCDRIAEKVGPEFMVRYRELMSELRSLDPRIEYIGGYKKVGS